MSPQLPSWLVSLQPLRRQFEAAAERRPDVRLWLGLAERHEANALDRALLCVGRSQSSLLLPLHTQPGCAGEVGLLVGERADVLQFQLLAREAGAHLPLVGLPPPLFSTAWLGLVVRYLRDQPGSLLLERSALEHRPWTQLIPSPHLASAMTIELACQAAASRQAGGELPVLTAEDRTILILLRDADRALLIDDIVAASRRAYRQVAEAARTDGLVELSESTVRRRVPLLAKQGLVVRPHGTDGKPLLRKGVAITERGRASLIDR